MFSKFLDMNTSINVPKQAGCITRCSEDLSVVNETTGADVSFVSWKLTDRTSCFRVVNAVNGANIVETSASYKASRRGIGACHDPAKTKWHCKQFVCGVGIPYNQFAVLRCWYQVPFIVWPMHRADFSQMPLEMPFHLHLRAAYSLQVLCHFLHCLHILGLVSSYWLPFELYSACRTCMLYLQVHTFFAWAGLSMLPLLFVQLQGGLLPRVDRSASRLRKAPRTHGFSSQWDRTYVM